ncbi:MAG: glutaredoxin family protein [Tissierellia bacterium]|nr:glutaredoxin family protein [Tissierellia bacterium]MDD4781015.1 glutaredoxin family protein [Tissierellia bacterium]
MRKIKIYTSSTCSHCHAAKDYLDEKGYTYEEKNISYDSEAKKELISQGFMGVPIIMVDDEVVEGFNKSKLDEML